MNNSTKKEEWRLYPIFFLIGILSLPVGLFLIGPLSGILTSLQNILCDLGWCGVDLLFASQFLFPFLMCSILLAVVLYFKEDSFVFALKIFVISFAAISLLFFGGLSFFNLIQPPIHPFLIFLLILLILFIVGLVAFKEHPLFGFAIRAFAFSFAFVLLATSAWFYGMMYYSYAMQDASTSASIYITSAENITIYVPVLLDNGSVLKMYENPTIEGDVTTAIIDTEKGKAIKINGSGSYFFSWNDVSGSDSTRLIKWTKEKLLLKKPEISKTDDKTITITEKDEIFIFKLEGKRVSLIKKDSVYRFDEKGNLISVEDGVVDEFFVIEENGKLKVYTGKIEISMNEKHGRLKDEAREEFLKRFAISMSNYAPSSTPQPAVDVWVYSDSEVEQLSFFLTLDPGGGRALSYSFIRPSGRISLDKGWQVVKLSGGIMHYD